MSRLSILSLRHPSRRRARGTSLIEVMIAVLIMGIGLLGIAAMQATALRNSQSSLERSQAVVQSYAILDAMRANRTAALAGDYTMAMACAVPTAVATLADSDKKTWIESIQTTLGTDACGQINCPTNGTCTVTVQWNESRASNAKAGGVEAGSDKFSIQTQTLI